MNIKLSTNNWLIWIIFLLQLSFFRLVPIKNFYILNGGQQQIFIVIIILVSFIINKMQPIRFKEGYSKIVWIFFGWYLFELVRSALYNGQGIINAFIASNFYLIIFSYYLFLYFYKLKENNYYDFKDIIIIITFVNSLLCILQFGLLFLHIRFMYLSDVLSIRFGTYRFNVISNPLAFLGLILSLSEILNKNSDRRIINYLNIIFGCLGFVFISKGRVSVITLVLTFVIMLLFRYRKNFIKMFYVLLFLAIITIFFFGSTIGLNYLNSMDSDNTADVRLREIEWYNSSTRNNLLTGVGFIRMNNERNEMQYIIRGPNGVYSRTDVGIWGLANALGICGVIWYVIFLVRAFMDIKYIYNNGFLDKNIYLIGIFIVFICYTPTMILMNPFGMIIIPIYMSFLDYCVHCIKNHTYNEIS